MNQPSHSSFDTGPPSSALPNDVPSFTNEPFASSLLSLAQLRTELHNFCPCSEATAWSLEKMGVADQFQGLMDKAPPVALCLAQVQRPSSFHVVRNPELLGRSRLS